MSIFGRKTNESEDDDVARTDVRAADIVEGRMTLVRAAGRKVILTRYEGKLYAVGNACPHAAASLSDGSLVRWKLTCPDHGYCFDIRSGRITWPEDEAYRLKTYEVWEEADGLVSLRL